VQDGGSAATTAPPYFGQDRRQRRSTGRNAVTTGELAAFAGTLLLVGLLLPTLLQALPSFSDATHAQGALRTAWSILFICAGLMRLVRWRLTGEARSAYLGVGMLCFGLLSAPSQAIAPLIEHDARDVWLSPVTRVLAVAVFQGVLARGLSSPTVNATVRPIRLIVKLILGSAAALVLFAAADGVLGPLGSHARFWFDVGIAQGVIWLALAAAAAYTGAKRLDPSTIWIGLGLLLMWIAELLHAIAFVSPPASAFYATCLQVVAGAIAVANSAADLGLVLAADGNRLLSLSGALHDAEVMLTEEEQEQAERLHDARSVIAALKAASITLDRYDERLDPHVKHRLRTSLVSELARLERVIAGRQEEPLRAFRVGTALEPLLIAEEENGLSIQADLSDFAVIGRPLELATVVQNVLVNARRYAPGSPVRIAATHLHGQIRIVVDDRGPGIDPAHRELIFERGHRALGDGNGSGLGLYLARRLMREQGGEINVRDRLGGGASFVLTLPAPSWNEKVEDGVEVLNSGHGQVNRAVRHGHATTLAGLPRQRNDDTTGEGARAVVGDDEVNERSLVRRTDLETT
jgi:signal transduction histidine kinase